jgi:hypothetical protein
MAARSLSSLTVGLTCHCHYENDFFHRVGATPLSSNIDGTGGIGQPIFSLANP